MSESLVLLGIALAGASGLPGLLLPRRSMAGQWITKIRRMASDFQNQFQEALREAEMEDLKKQVGFGENTSIVRGL